MPTARPALILLTGLVTALAGCAGGLDSVRSAAERGVDRAVNREVSNAADRTTTAALRGLEDAARCAVSDEACVERARREGRDVVLVDADGAPLPAERQPAGTAAAMGAADAGYDFTPGTRTLYAEDFEDERAGDVPGRIDFHDGVLEVVRVGGNQALRFSSAGAFAIPLPEALPERFTVELDLYSADNWNSLVLGTGPLDRDDDGYHCFQGQLQNHSAAVFKVGSFFETGVAGGTGGTSVVNQSAHEERMVPVQVSVDGSYVKMYVDGRRVANVPNADVRRTRRVLVTACGEIAAEDDGHAGPVLIDNVRIAAGARATPYEAFEADGRVVLEGVQFETGSAALAAGSEGPLAEAARLLRGRPGLRVRVEGHTDDTGSAEGNRRLSERRARAVRDWLVASGVDASRLEAVGVGPAQPVASNATAEGRARNRRVELVRL